jgi:long-chain fatty acid transport protein
VDYQKISYSDVRSVSNASGAIMLGVPLGAVNGSGFGWSDVNVMKLGVQWQATSALTVRAGVNVGDNPVKSADVTFNILAPGVVTTHYTLGGTYAISPTAEISMAYTLVPSNSVSGPSLGALMQGGNETIKMSQQSLGVQFGWHWK